MENKEFNWESNDTDDDFTCHVDGCCLRAEQMRDNVWWWCVYWPDGEEVYSSYTKGEWCKSGDEAKSLAQKSFVSLRETKPA